MLDNHVKSANGSMYTLTRFLVHLCFCFVSPVKRRRRRGGRRGGRRDQLHIHAVKSLSYFLDSNVLSTAQGHLGTARTLMSHPSYRVTWGQPAPRCPVHRIGSPRDSPHLDAVISSKHALCNLFPTFPTIGAQSEVEIYMFSN